MAKKIIISIKCLFFIILLYLMETHTTTGFINAYEGFHYPHSFASNYFSYHLFTISLYRTALIMIPLLAISFFIRHKIHSPSLLRSATISGGIALVIEFILLLVVDKMGAHLLKLLLFSFIAFSIGFMYVILYRTFSKEPLFSEGFY